MEYKSANVLELTKLILADMRGNKGKKKFIEGNETANE